MLSPEADLERILAANAAKPVRERLTRRGCSRSCAGSATRAGYDAVRRYARVGTGAGGRGTMVARRPGSGGSRCRRAASRRGASAGPGHPV